VDVPWLELDGVDLRVPAQQLDVLGPQDGALPEVGPEVVR
jgi:hypothetical protein